MTIAPEIHTFRDTAEQYSPVWLRNTWGVRLVYALAIMFDLLADWASAAAHCRFPTWCAQHMPDGLALLGRERGIRRGLVETDTAYAVRQTRWLVDRKRRGSPYALMSQLSGYLSGYSCRVRVVNCIGAWYTREADGTESYRGPWPRNWDWDGDDDAWSRYWVIVYVPSDLWQLNTSWDQVWGAAATGTLGCTATPDQWSDMLEIIRDWNPPHARCARLILAFDDSSFDPAGSGAGYPSGDWKNQGKDTAGNYDRARLTSARFGAGL